MKDEIAKIKEEINEIKERNRKVEIDKMWETSLARKIAIATLTYITIVGFFIVMQSSKPFLNAIVPTLGFIFSTLSLGLLKEVWLRIRKDY